MCGSHFLDDSFAIEKIVQCRFWYYLWRFGNSTATWSHCKLEWNLNSVTKLGKSNSSLVFWNKRNYMILGQWVYTVNLGLRLNVGGIRFSPFALMDTKGMKYPWMAMINQIGTFLIIIIVIILTKTSFVAKVKIGRYTVHKLLGSLGHAKCKMKIT